jgi:hypothetical protein
MGMEVAHEVQSLADWIEGNLYRIMKQRRASEVESVA